MSESLDIFKSQIAANQIIYWCENKENIIYDSALSSSFKCIRFSTEFVNSVFPPSKTAVGIWKNGKYIIYEISLEADGFVISCTVSRKDLSPAKDLKLNYLKEKFNIKDSLNADLCKLREWKYSDYNDLSSKLDDFYENELPYFEAELRLYLKEYETQKYDESKEELLLEGYLKEIASNKYERNREARKKCIEHYGAVCQICGFDFGKVYGNEFSGRIDVHHIKPLSEIGREYVVDPIKDLIPVCPNCHAACHYRDDGVWQPNQILERIKLNREN